MRYKHFTVDEREKIQEMLWEKESVRAIARILGRTPSSVSREIKRNKPPQQNRYTPRVAHERAVKKRSSRGREERLKNEKVREYVVQKLKLGWSPEQIGGTCKEATGYSISHEAIYQYIYAQIHRDGHGSVKPGCEDLRVYLAWRRKRRMYRGGRKSYHLKHGPLPSIDDRPKEVDRRKVVGHWEDDSVVSKASPDRLRTTNERRSGIVFIARAKNGTIEEANRITIERLGALPQKLRKTLTRDRGTENLGYRELQTVLGIRPFFAHPYHSWEHGSNENTNGLIRRFFPKKTDFSTITDVQIAHVEYLLNSRPRKRLGFKTPYQIFYQLTGVALDG